MTGVPKDYIQSRPLLAWFGALALLFVITGTLKLVQGFALHEIAIEKEDPAKRGNAAIVVPFHEEISDDKNYILPAKEKDRLDILVMGIRGKDDAENGGLLTDTMLVLSFDKITHQASIVSIPRDLYLKIGKDTIDKVNSAFERLGIKETRLLMSRVTGVYIDNVVVLDFKAFGEVVDAVGGVDVELSKPFEEAQQWGYTFKLPAGTNHLNGQDALYYVRSRYSTDDFDRANRQQNVLLALKKKIFSGDLLSDPAKILVLISAIRKNIQTDIDILNIKNLLDLATEISSAQNNVRQAIISTDNLLYDTKTPGGLYVLLPKGDDLDGIKKFFQEILTPGS